MNQEKTLAGVVTSQTNNEASFSEEVENNVSNSTLSVKERIELFEKGTKQEPDLNTECKLASLNVISNSSDSSITVKIDEAGADFSVSCSSLVLDDGKDIEDEFNAVCEANGIEYNRPYSLDQFEAASNTSSNPKIDNTKEMQKEEEDKELGDKPKPLPRNGMLEKDNIRNVAPPSPRTAENHRLSIIQDIAPPKLPHSSFQLNGEKCDEQEAIGEPMYATIDKNKKFSKRGLDGEINDQSPEMEKSNSEETSIKKGSEDIIGEPVDLNTKFLKKSLEGSDSGIDNRSAEMTRSNSQVTEMSESCGNQGWENMSLNHDSPVTLSTSSSEKSDNEETPLIKKEKKTNRILPRVKYAVQQKEFIIFGIAAVALSVSAALVYLQDKAQFIAFFANSVIYVTIPILAVALLVAISPIFCGIKQFRDTEECQIGGKNANETLNQVLKYQPKDKVIKSVKLEYGNGTHSHFTLNAWEGKNNFINIDDKVISRRNKVESVIKDRPLFTALLSSLVAANIVLPLLLYVEGGINSVQKFYQNALINNVGLSLLIGSSILALSVIFLGGHYYRKTNCTNLVYCEERIEPEKVNGKFIEEIKEARTKVLEENHSKDAKCSSLTLEQVVVESHNYKDAIYSIS
ncbi:hypothetical protein [Wolbachia endosymbiont of Drosophila pseudotakahashii]|uniref:hypothetical protein n=1 Tax=Wolbachia endosymbiont of Drosophila pseudotakahashii TaxID=375919 RepID=UPI002230A3C5|nr:hypothetical protein [Wolbachia endosymbiont of Drosophila pseudotakahashii]MCX3064484.1 hypothetical protein [Wolbachia endosymbiont of Drosophila pseudotakahashii]UZE39124.1 hypothetical protein ONI09_03410 [Wolbachia endosymbiont of Drosophila pseudotakahashii]